MSHNKYKCEFCGRFPCGCGADVLAAPCDAVTLEELGRWWFPYDGFIVWIYYDPSKDSYIAFFYLGRDLVGQVERDRGVVDDFRAANPGLDTFPELFYTEFEESQKES